MNWWKARNGISTDPKLAIVARLCNSRKCEVGWVWVTLLDHASQAHTRGNISGISTDELAVLTDLPETQISAIMAALRKRGLVQENGNLTAWEKHNGSSDPTNAERQRRFREAHRNVTARNALCNTEEREEIVVSSVLTTTEKPSNGNGFHADEAFSELWNDYPSKGRVKRVLAEQYYCEEIRSSESHRHVMDRIRLVWNRSDKWAKGFVMALPEWIHNRCWDEEPPSVEAAREEIESRRPKSVAQQLKEEIRNGRIKTR